jgi:hypothetical protein
VGRFGASPSQRTEALPERPELTWAAPGGERVYALRWTVSRETGAAAAPGALPLSGQLDVDVAVGTVSAVSAQHLGDPLRVVLGIVKRLLPGPPGVAPHDDPVRARVGHGRHVGARRARPGKKGQPDEGECGAGGERRRGHRAVSGGITRRRGKMGRGAEKKIA